MGVHIFYNFKQNIFIVSNFWAKKIKEEGGGEKVFQWQCVLRCHGLLFNCKLIPFPFHISNPQFLTMLFCPYNTHHLPKYYFIYLCLLFLTCFSTVEGKLHEDICLVYTLIYPKHLEKSLAHVDAQWITCWLKNYREAVNLKILSRWCFPWWLRYNFFKMTEKIWLRKGVSSFIRDMRLKRVATQSHRAGQWESWDLVSISHSGFSVLLTKLRRLSCL